MTSNAFSDRLAAGIRARTNPVVVGLDPRFGSLPEPFTNGIDDGDLSAVAKAYRMFCEGIIDVVAPLVPAVKPQSAFFEQLGPSGTEALSHVIRYARQAGLIVVHDAKRGDIGSTAEAYAAAYLGAESPWAADALTVNPYLGDDSLQPFVDVCGKRDAGIFVLVKTSNPGGGLFQDVVVDGQPMYARVAKLVERHARQSSAECGYGSIGAVVGATYPEQLAELRELMPHAWYLVPGFGSQGGTAKSVKDAFDERGLGAIINSSRAIIFAHQRQPFAQKFGASRWQEAVDAATREMINQLRAETTAGLL